MPNTDRWVTVTYDGNYQLLQALRHAVIHAAKENQTVNSGYVKETPNTYCLFLANDHTAHLEPHLTFVKGNNKYHWTIAVVDPELNRQRVNRKINCQIYWDGSKAYLASASLASKMSESLADWNAWNATGNAYDKALAEFNQQRVGLQLLLNQAIERFNIKSKLTPTRPQPIAVRPSAAVAAKKASQTASNAPSSNANNNVTSMPANPDKKSAKAQQQKARQTKVEAEDDALTERLLQEYEEAARNQSPREPTAPIAVRKRFLRSHKEQYTSWKDELLRVLGKPYLDSLLGVNQRLIKLATLVQKLKAPDSQDLIPPSASIVHQLQMMQQQIKELAAHLDRLHQPFSSKSLLMCDVVEEMVSDPVLTKAIHTIKVSQDLIFRTMSSLSFAHTAIDEPGPKAELVTLQQDLLGLHNGLLSTARQLLANPERPDTFSKTKINARLHYISLHVQQEIKRMLSDQVKLDALLLNIRRELNQLLPLIEQHTKTITGQLDPRCFFSHSITMALDAIGDALQKAMAHNMIMPDTRAPEIVCLDDDTRQAIGETINALSTLNTYVDVDQLKTELNAYAATAPQRNSSTVANVGVLQAMIIHADASAERFKVQLTTLQSALQKSSVATAEEHPDAEQSSDTPAPQPPRGY